MIHIIHRHHCGKCLLPSPIVFTFCASWHRKYSSIILHTYIVTYHIKTYILNVNLERKKEVMFFFMIGAIFLLIVLFSFVKILIEKISIPRDALQKEIADLKRRIEQLENKENNEKKY